MKSWIRMFLANDWRIRRRMIAQAIGPYKVLASHPHWHGNLHECRCLTRREALAQGRDIDARGPYHHWEIVGPLGDRASAEHRCRVAATYRPPSAKQLARERESARERAAEKMRLLKSLGWKPV